MSVEVGIGGPAEYPEGISIGAVASMHDEGAGKLPRRQIIVHPDQSIIGQMIQDMTRALLR